MKTKYFVCLVVLTALVGLSVNAQQGGGYKGPGVGAITIEEAKSFREGSTVTLQGKIERFLGNDKFIFPEYSFADNSGSLTLIIFDSIWGDLSVDQNDVVEITGIVYRDSTEVKVLVRRLTMVS